MNDWKVTDSNLAPTLSDRFDHIISAIDQIEECLQGLSQQQLAADRMLPVKWAQLFLASKKIAIALERLKSRSDAETTYRAFVDDYDSFIRRRHLAAPSESSERLSCLR